MIGTFVVVDPVFWPYLVGVTLLLIGLVTLFKDGWPRAGGIDSALRFGPLFLAVPMGVFGADHFISPKTIAAMVPSWIPGHFFWVYFCAVGLIAAGLSIVVGRYSTLAATLLGSMLLSFVLLIHIPSLMSEPHDRFALAVLFRDLSFSAGAFALAAGRAKMSGSRLRYVGAVLRTLIAVAVVVFGVEHFLHPDFVPVVPLRQPMPSWIPAHVPLAYLTGTVLILTGSCMLFNWRPRLAATCLGIAVLVVIGLVYLPLLVASPSDIIQLNYFADTLAFSGTAFLIANVLRNKKVVEEHTNAAGA